MISGDSSHGFDLHTGNTNLNIYSAEFETTAELMSSFPFLVSSNFFTNPLPLGELKHTRIPDHTDFQSLRHQELVISESCARKADQIRSKLNEIGYNLTNAVGHQNMTGYPAPFSTNGTIFPSTAMISMQGNAVPAVSFLVTPGGLKLPSDMDSGTNTADLLQCTLKTKENTALGLVTSSFTTCNTGSPTDRVIQNSSFTEHALLSSVGQTESDSSSSILECGDKNLNVVGVTARGPYSSSSLQWPDKRRSESFSTSPSELRDMKYGCETDIPVDLSIRPGTREMTPKKMEGWKESSNILIPQQFE